ncbi:PD-(D/E)XK motif protein [Fictibacillus enclensis]|uniref:PD-(D/E)XK motif protein n=1 Tax=Fictibacillus enclensis TaxID=1017270 RepID=UPI0025A233CB|nr:PD-(D/E)XK motif protein [Fictibacillus enclensis]MDM5337366.1 PD-(D/E)XK motif protein [Fictibacillus enclensis]
MKTDIILDKFKLLSGSKNHDEYNLISINSNLYIGRNYENNLCLFLKFCSNHTLPFGRKTKGLQLIFYAANTFSIKGISSIDNWGCIVCTDKEKDLLFATLIEGVVDLAHKNTNFSPEDFSNYIYEWQDLLSNEKTLNNNELIGLWGELYFIISTPYPERTINYWRGPESKVFDFSKKGIDIEVKTSLKGHQHVFNEDQLISSNHKSKRYVHSLYVQEDFSGGNTTTQLIDKIRKLLKKQGPFEKKLLSYGYNGPLSSEKPLCIKGERMISINNIPKVLNKDIGVYNVRFESNLSFSETENISNILKDFK